MEGTDYALPPDQRRHRITHIHAGFHGHCLVIHIPHFLNTNGSTTESGRVDNSAGDIKCGIR